jgi:hypothetical protein
MKPTRKRLDVVMVSSSGKIGSVLFQKNHWPGDPQTGQTVGLFKREVPMSGRSQTGHNQMLKRRRLKKYRQKQLNKAAKAEKKLRNKKS